ncbi:MAG: NAD(P)-dependent oxidoreductase, partial [bacterium]
MNIFITGGTGFIGSHVAMAFVDQGHKITMLARNPNKVPKFAEISNIEIVEGDITDAKLIERLVCGHDACVHIALNYRNSSGSEVLINDTLPTVQLSDYAKNAKVKHFIYTSSTAANDSSYSSNKVTGDVNVSLITSQTKQRPATFYGATKTASENFLIAQSYQSDMRINIIRPGYVFGNPVIEGAF